MFRPTRIIVHHSATVDSGTVSWGAIWNYHVRTRGWRDIGYHAGVELARGRYEAFYGRPVTEGGAHTRGENQDSLGICFVGDFDETEPPRAQLWVGVKRVLLPWMAQFGIGLDRIYGHRSFSRKTCPGLLFDMDRLKDMIKQEKSRNVV